MAPKFICTFTTGRTGTAMLQQLLSGAIWRKNTPRLVSDFKGLACEVRHEGWELPISEVKKGNMQIDVLRSLILSSSADRMICTDNRIGRFFGDALSQIGLSVGVIRLRRDSEDVVDSYFRRIKNREKKYSKDRFDEYLRYSWGSVFYDPFQENTILKLTKSTWSRMTLQDQLRWYCEETDARWLNLRDRLSFPYIEVRYLDLCSTRAFRILQDFTELKIRSDGLFLRSNPS